MMADTHPYFHRFGPMTYRYAGDNSGWYFQDSARLSPAALAARLRMEPGIEIVRPPAEPEEPVLRDQSMEARLRSSTHRRESHLNVDYLIFRQRGASIWELWSMGDQPSLLTTAVLPGQVLDVSLFFTSPARVVSLDEESLLNRARNHEAMKIVDEQRRTQEKW